MGFLITFTLNRVKQIVIKPRDLSGPYNVVPQIHPVKETMRI